MDNKHVVIFDGVCNFCNGSVNFIINHDPNTNFVFAPMQSNVAKELIEKYKMTDAGIDTFILIKNGVFYTRTNAALEITKDLSGYWYLFNITKVMPRPIRDLFYRIFARNRYRLFGKRNTCMMPTSEVKSRFLI